MDLSMLNVFSDNPMLIIALVAFLACVVIGFFGDRYLRKQNKIGKILSNNNLKEKTEETQEVQPVSDTNINEAPLITSENVNDNVSVTNEVVSQSFNSTSQNDNVATPESSGTVAPSFEASSMNVSDTTPIVNDVVAPSFDNPINNDNIGDSILTTDPNMISNVQNSNPNVLQSNVINEEVSAAITPNIEQPALTDVIASDYPAENSPQNVTATPTPFDGQVTMDENINNMF